MLEGTGPGKIMGCNGSFGFKVVTDASHDLINDAITNPNTDYSNDDNDPTNRPDFLDFEEDSDEIRNEIKYSAKKLNHYESAPGNVVASHSQCNVCLIGVSYNRNITKHLLDYEQSDDMKCTDDMGNVYSKGVV